MPGLAASKCVSGRTYAVLTDSRPFPGSTLLFLAPPTQGLPSLTTARYSKRCTLRDLPKHTAYTADRASMFQGKAAFNPNLCYNLLHQGAMDPVLSTMFQFTILHDLKITSFEI
jgi:hypothetical protein